MHFAGIGYIRYIYLPTGSAQAVAVNLAEDVNRPTAVCNMCAINALDCIDKVKRTANGKSIDCWTYIASMESKELLIL